LTGVDVIINHAKKYHNTGMTGADVKAKNETAPEKK
jgi:hypothetical protein